MPARARRTTITALVAGAQALGAIYVLIDGAREGFGMTDVVVGIALLLGVAYGAATLRALQREADRREHALAAARGELSAIIGERFAGWRLSPSEADVALFSLKGCPIAEIAALRGTARGTIRAQLASIYGKAGVDSQPALMAVFLDQLIETPPISPRN